MKTIRISGMKVCALDIPPGTSIEKVMRGGETALQDIMGLLQEKSFDGYVKVSLEREEEDVTSYIVIEGSEPRLGVREVINKDIEDPKRKVRRLYAGEQTLEDVKRDANNENATIEVHSGVDIEAIINRYGKKTSSAREARGPRKVGLFWGGKQGKTTLETEMLEEKLKNWKQEGYEVSSLESILTGDMEEAKAAFEVYEEGITKLEDMAAELDLLALAGFENEVKSIRSRLNDPSQIQTLKAEIEALENSLGEAKEEAVDEFCLVCGFPVKGGGKCPRCGAGGEVEVEEPVEPTKKVEKSIELLAGHCYLIEEEKLERSLKLFTDTLNKGYKGFSITRTNPKHLKGIKGLTNTTIVWLTDKESKTEATIPPVLERLIYEIGDFLRSEEKGCLILDGIEYLVSSNSFDAVLRFIRRLVDEVSESGSIFLVAVSPYTFKNIELKILEREMEKLVFEDD
jgi:hypothetical protein